MNYRLDTTNGWVRMVAGTLGVLFITTASSFAADTTKPTAPTNLAATVLSATQINLTWTASTDNVGVTGYHIERCSGSGCSAYSEIATTSNIAFSDANLSSGTHYRYRVRANDASGNLSGYSSAVAALTTDVTPPATPTNLAAVAVSGTKITLTWNAATDNIKVTGYRIESCSGTGCSDFAQIATTATALTYNNTGLVSVTTHSYRVSAVDAAGNVSAYSNNATATTLDSISPVKPTGFTATSVSSVEIDLAWIATTDNVGVTGYHVERCSGSGCSSFTEIGTTAGITYKDSSLSASTLYRYRIRANDAAGNISAYSSAAAATTKAGDTQPPTVPTSLSTSVISPTQLDLSWMPSMDNVGIANYLIERCQGSSCSNFIQVGSSITATYSDVGLTASTFYSYRVKASDAANNLSAYSNISSATTPIPTDTTPPSAPTDLNAIASSATQINLSWSASDDDVAVTNYLIERCEGPGCNSFAALTTTTDVTYSNTALTPATNYSYRVRATDAANNLSDYSSVAYAATQFSGPITYVYSYDDMGRITQASGSDGSVITYSYDANGNITTLNRQ